MTDRRPDHDPVDAAAAGGRPAAERASGCEAFRDQIEALLFDHPLPPAGEAPAGGRVGGSSPRGELGEHLGECPACAELLALHAELLAWEDAQPVPSRHEELQVRRRVLAALDRETAGEPDRASRRERLDRRLRGGAFDVRRLALAASVVLALAAAFAAGRLSWSSPATSSAALPSSSGDRAPIATATRADLASSLLEPIAASLDLAGGQDVEGGPYSFDNVQLHAIDGDRVRLSFDYSIHLEVDRPRRDPLVTEVLVHAILDGGSLGTQLKAIDAADEPALTPRLRTALIRTMLEDDSAPARQAALERLLPDAAIPEVEDALLQVLEHEASVRMRLLAIDALAAGGVPAQRLERALEAGPDEPGQALRLRVGDVGRSL